jgi:solute carrier family 25, member 42
MLQIQHVTGRDVTTLERLECGAVAGLFAQTLTYPIEVTRRRMQTLGLVGNDTAFGNVGVTANGSVGGAGAADSSMKRPPNLAQTIRHLYAEQGVRGFFKGVSVNWAKGPIAFGISFTMFDTVQHFLETPAERALRLPRGH